MLVHQRTTTTCGSGLWFCFGCHTAYRRYDVERCFHVFIFTNVYSHFTLSHYSCRLFRSYFLSFLLSLHTHSNSYCVVAILGISLHAATLAWFVFRHRTWVTKNWFRHSVSLCVYWNAPREKHFSHVRCDASYLNSTMPGMIFRVFFVLLFRTAPSSPSISLSLSPYSALMVFYFYICFAHITAYVADDVHNFSFIVRSVSWPLPVYW